ncbi:MAG TPA: hypothetical protein VGQ49_14075 [Bryobacteraceae bacterium]|jgi:hypothetical protein|nr:hypothetical protein [Bryobacteraceae bacterium]
MSKLHRRLNKLEALITDESGMVPGFQKWMDYWSERADKILTGENGVSGDLISSRETHR